MSALRAVRIQKPMRNKERDLSMLDDVANGSSEPDSSQEITVVSNKRPRVLSDDEDDTSISVASQESSRGASSEFGHMSLNKSSSEPSFSASRTPSDEEIESKLDHLQGAFPNTDRMELLDALRAANYNMMDARSRVTASFRRQDHEPPRKKFVLPKKRVVKRHDAGDSDGSASSDSEGEYNDNNVVYESDSDEDGYGVSDSNLSEDKKRVLSFFNKALEQELTAINGCSKKKVEGILELRPFESWTDLVRKFQISRQLNTDMLNSATVLVKMRDAIAKLMEKCEKITNKMTRQVENLTNGDRSALELKEQPRIMNPDLKITGYQLIGVNWLIMMHKSNVNGVLADEMGLGKTIQTISFLAHLKEMGDEGPHLIIVPSSTMENWQKEISLWCPSIKVLNYYGSQDERRFMRLQIVNEEVEFDVILTTYNMVTSSAEDRVLFRKLDFHYVVFDEAHMLKNMATARYENLMRVRAIRKLLLTGTPMQNNLVELMSLLVFVMPDMFANKKEQLKKMFSMFPKTSDDGDRSKYERDRIAHAKRIMRPFFLRRLKSEVLTDLPKKTESVMRVPLSESQLQLYRSLVADYKERARAIAAGEIERYSGESGVGLMMNLRKVANHPLLIRQQYDDAQLRVLGKLLKKADPSKELEYIIEDLSVLSDFEIHLECLKHRSIEHHALGNNLICDSGKFELMDKMLPEMKSNGDRVLIFTQFVKVLEVMERYLKIRGHKFLRLDGQTPVQERQMLIDQFNRDDSIFIFILSTKAGGLGINLTAANTVIIHDLDFNPHNDKQAEDRCHRVGQTRPVKVIRFLGEDTIEEGMYTIAQDKLKLEKELSEEADDNGGEAPASKKDLKRLLKIALDVEMSEKQLGDIGKVFTEI